MWSEFSFSSGAIEEILKRDSFTLEDILSEDEVASEARNHKKNLIDVYVS